MNPTSPTGNDRSSIRYCTAYHTTQFRSAYCSRRQVATERSESPYVVVYAVSAWSSIRQREVSRLEALV